MTESIDTQQYHTNAEYYKLTYPEGTRFAEDFTLTEQDRFYPTAKYTSPEHLQDELEYVWYRTWQMACREDEIPHPGDYYEYIIGDQSILIIRGDDRKIRAFYNACTHRGTQLKTGCGNDSDITCPYHAWCFSLKGRLIDVPDAHVFPHVSADTHSLTPVGCDTWAGFIFVNPDAECAEKNPLRKFLGRIVDDIEPYHMENYRAVSHATLDLQANWKVALEVFPETYHVSFTHPQIATYMDDVNTQFEMMGDHSRMILPYGVSSMRLQDVDLAELYQAYFHESATAFRHHVTDDLPPELFDDDGNWKLEKPMREYLIDEQLRLGDVAGHDYSELTQGQIIDDYDYHVFPGFKFNAHAGAALAFRARPHATDPNRCHFDVYKFIWPAADEDFEKSAPAVHIDWPETSMGLVVDQDLRNISRVQRGLKSRSLKMVSLGKVGVRISNYHKVLDRMIDEHRSLAAK